VTPDAGANIVGVRSVLNLTPEEQAMLAGERGEGVAMAMRIVAALAEAAGADMLLQVESAHVDGGLYHGPVGLEFAERLAEGGGRVAVPTTMNVSSLDMLHPELIRLDTETRDRARRLMDTYVAMGCQPTWTCAPYQLPGRPTFGQHVAWGESNAIVFANSVLGARTGRYGDFTDICAALTGRVPDSGLHRDENRVGQIVFSLDWLESKRDVPDALFGLLGIVVGEESGSLMPVILGLPPDTNEDQLKALGAAAASSGSVAMFHAVGITPEAHTLTAALGGERPRAEIGITPQRLRSAWDALTGADAGTPLAAVSVGTPHFSVAQFAELESLLDGRAIHPDVEMYVSTGRDTLRQIESTGMANRLTSAGIRIVVDTCTYVTPILQAGPNSTVVTDSAKWAWYAPANLNVKVVYGTLADSVESAVAGSVVRGSLEVLHG
jgi:hypothetical protein